MLSSADDIMGTPTRVRGCYMCAGFGSARSVGVIGGIASLSVCERVFQVFFFAFLVDMRSVCADAASLLLLTCCVAAVLVVPPCTGQGKVT